MSNENEKRYSIEEMEEMMKRTIKKTIEEMEGPKKQSSIFNVAVGAKEKVFSAGKKAVTSVSDTVEGLRILGETSRKEAEKKAVADELVEEARKAIYRAQGLEEE